MKTRKVFTRFATMILIVALVGVIPAAAAQGGVGAPVLGRDAATAIPGRYIVILRSGIPAEEVRATAERSVTADQARGNSGQVHFVYESALNGFAASLSDQAVIELSQNPNVEFIEADQVVTGDATQSPAPWGLDRIDQRKLPLNNKYRFNSTGAGVDVFIIDSGIRFSHNEFAGRIFTGPDFVDNDSSSDDCSGHGTHVAGIVGGSTFGVAKRVSLVAVRVLDCLNAGTVAGAIAGINWVTEVHTTQKAVANISFGGPASAALDNAVRNSIADGVVYVIAAGNNNRNACQSSPARVGEAITVGATTPTDARASFSNKGRCLDLFAPGVDIISASVTGDTDAAVFSGTSQAAPHVAGAAALYLQGHNASPQRVRNVIVNAATAGVVKNRGDGSPNLLLFSLLGDDD
ncbi:MAG TPA: S8 family peptidase [Anaerolineales bacterium]|nr:S8 family peptidase [Anaerolineales bacterium]